MAASNCWCEAAAAAVDDEPTEYDAREEVRDDGTAAITALPAANRAGLGAALVPPKPLPTKVRVTVTGVVLALLLPLPPVLRGRPVIDCDAECCVRRDATA